MLDLPPVQHPPPTTSLSALVPRKVAIHAHHSHPFRAHVLRILHNFGTSATETHADSCLCKVKMPAVTITAANIYISDALATLRNFQTLTGKDLCDDPSTLAG